MDIQQLYTNYANNKAFRGLVRENPEVFATTIDIDTEVKIVFNESDTLNIVMPPNSDSLSDDALDYVSGGIFEGSIIGFAIPGSSSDQAPHPLFSTTDAPLQALNEALPGGDVGVHALDKD